VDRLGQSRRVHAFHLTARATFEETVVARLLARRARAEDDLGDRHGATEPVVAARVFGEAAAKGDEVFGDQASAMSGSPDTQPWTLTASDEAWRVSACRRLLALAGAASADTFWCHPRRPGATRCLAAIVEVTARSAEGRTEWSSIVALRVALNTASSDTRRWARLCRSVARDPRVRQAAISAARATASVANWSPVIDRLQAIRRAREHHREAGLQPSLFDRRAVRAAEARDIVLARLADHAQRQSRVLGGGKDGARLEVRVVALLPFAGERTR
jgi:hypothetical protein